MSTRLNKRGESKDNNGGVDNNTNNKTNNEYNNAINNYKTRKLMAIRPYSVADNFRMDDVSSQYNDNEPSARINLIKHSVRSNANNLPN